MQGVTAEEYKNGSWETLNSDSSKRILFSKDAKVYMTQTAVVFQIGTTN